jgi:hypothetical protein
MTRERANRFRRGRDTEPACTVRKHRVPTFPTFETDVSIIGAYGRRILLD